MIAVEDRQLAEAVGLIQSERLTRDLREATLTLTDDEARYLVDLYYVIQDDRKGLGSQGKAMDRRDQAEPHALLDWFFRDVARQEKNIEKALDIYSASKLEGQWARSILGIGPVIAAGLLAHIDITKAPTAGHIWRFAGLDDPKNYKWTKRTKDEPGTKRPWNAALKTLCWKIGESFVKVQNNEADIYGHLYAERKDLEWARNMEGLFADQCDAGLAKLKPRKDQDAKYWYSGCLTPDVWTVYEQTPADERQALVRRMAGVPGSGVRMLPPAHIHNRAKRPAVKLFLAHYQYVAYEIHYGEPPPKPYVIEHLGHAHYLKPPNWPME